MTGVPVRNTGLTVREQETIALVAQGFSNQEIASHLKINEKTVRTHVSIILSKYGVGNRTEAAMIYRDLTEIVDDREIRRLREQIKSLQQEFSYLKLIMDKFGEHIAKAL